MTKLARDRAAQLERDSDKVTAEIRRRVQADATKRGGFHGVHCFPREAADIPDDPSVRLVILGVEAFYIKGGGKSPAEAAARTTPGFQRDRSSSLPQCGRLPRPGPNPASGSRGGSPDVPRVAVDR